MNLKRGWLRLGIVVTVLWLVCSSAIYFAGIFAYPSMFNSFTSPTGFPFYDWVEHKPIMVGDQLLTPLAPTFRPMGFALFTIGPPAAIWLIVAAAWAVYWVRTGFRDES